MKGILLTLALGSIGALCAAESFSDAASHSFQVRNKTPQQIADAIADAVHDQPEKASAIVRATMMELNNHDAQFSEAQKKQVSAVISAAIATAPPGSGDLIVAAGVSVIPALGTTIAKAADASSSDLSGSPSNASPSEMLLGNIRVQSIEGKGAKFLNKRGEVSSLKEGDFLRQGVRIITGQDASVVLLFENGSIVQLNPNTEFSIDKFEVDPFDYNKIEYNNIENEPTRSVTRTSVITGEMNFDVASLKKSSLYEIITPVGIAGIRGTGGFTRVSLKNQAQAGCFGLYEGSASFTTSNGKSQLVRQSQSIGVGGRTRNFDIILNPPDGVSSLAQSSKAMSQARSKASNKSFKNSPPPKTASSGPISSLSQDQQKALQDAANAGPEAISEIALELAMQSPDSSAEIAAAAADMAPALAATIAAIFCNTFPNQASSISASISIVIPVQAANIAVMVSMTTPSQAAAIATAIAAAVPYQALPVTYATAIAVPSQAALIAASVALANPSQATTIASVVATILPAQASAIAAEVAKILPSQASSIASAVSAAVPSKAVEIANAVSVAVPAQSNAIGATVAASAPNEAALVGGAASTRSNPFLDASNGAIGADDEGNPDSLIPETPKPAATPSPSPTPPTSVSPSA